jgi:hypothetical protein
MNVRAALFRISGFFVAELCTGRLRFSVLPGSYRIVCSRLETSITSHEGTSSEQ